MNVVGAEHTEQVSRSSAEPVGTESTPTWHGYGARNFSVHSLARQYVQTVQQPTASDEDFAQSLRSFGEQQEAQIISYYFCENGPAGAILLQSKRGASDVVHG